MNLLSIGCLSTLVLYLLISLTLPTGKTERQKLFRMIYSALELGLVGVGFFVVFESLVAYAQSVYGIAPEENILRRAFGLLMLAIPLCLVTVALHMIRKKPRPLPYLIAAGAVILAGTLAVLAYTGFSSGAFTRASLGIDSATGQTLYSGSQIAETSNALMEVAAFALVYLPFVFHFLVSGLLDTDTRWARVLHWVSLWLNLATAVGLLAAIGLWNLDLLAALGTAALGFLPFVLICLALPAIPLLVFRHMRVKEAIRSGAYTSQWVGYEKWKARRAEKKAGKKAGKAGK